MLAGSSTHPCGVGNGSFDAGTDHFTHDRGQLNQDWTKAPPALRQSLQWSKMMAGGMTSPFPSFFAAGSTIGLSESAGIVTEYRTAEQ